MSATIRWKSGTNATRYQVWRHTATDDPGAATLLADDVPGHSYEDTTAVAGTVYWYYIKAKNGLGTSSISSGVWVEAKLRPPTQLMATLLDDAKVTLTWVASSGASSYEVQRADNSAFTGYSVLGTTSGTTWDDTTASADSPYWYRLKAKTAGISGYSDPSLAAIGYKAIAVPATPTGVDATDDEDDQVTVTWSAAARAQVYDVYRNTVNNSSTATLVATVTGLSHVDTSVTDGTTYYYWIKARNYTGSSAFSTVTTGTPFSLVPPSSIDATAVDCDSSIDVDWSAVTGVASYKLYRNTVNNSATASLIATIAAGTLTYNDGGLSPFQTYYYWIKSYDGSTLSAFSSVASDTTSSIPATPSGVSADGRLQFINLSWSPITGATYYEVWRSTINDAGTASWLANASGTSYADFDVDYTTNPYVVYYYWLKAANSCGASGLSTTGGSANAWQSIFDADVSTTSGASWDRIYWKATTGSIRIIWDTDTVADRLRMTDLSGGAGLFFDTGFTVYHAPALDTTAGPITGPGLIRVQIDLGGGSIEWSLTVSPP